MKKFTVDQFRNYLNSKDSMGDALYYLSENEIEKADNAIHQRDPNEDDDEFEDYTG